MVEEYNAQLLHRPLFSLLLFPSPHLLSLLSFLLCSSKVPEDVRKKMVQFFSAGAAIAAREEGEEGEEEGGASSAAAASDPSAASTELRVLKQSHFSPDLCRRVLQAVRLPDWQTALQAGPAAAAAGGGGRRPGSQAGSSAGGTVTGAANSLGNISSISNSSRGQLGTAGSGGRGQLSSSRGATGVFTGQWRPSSAVPGSSGHAAGGEARGELGAAAAGGGGGSTDGGGADAGSSLLSTMHLFREGSAGMVAAGGRSSSARPGSSGSGSGNGSGSASFLTPLPALPPGFAGNRLASLLDTTDTVLVAAAGGLLHYLLQNKLVEEDAGEGAGRRGWSLAGKGKGSSGHSGMRIAADREEDMEASLSLVASAASRHSSADCPILLHGGFHMLQLQELMQLDAAAMSSLSIFSLQRHPGMVKATGKGKEGFSLAALLDKTVSAVGHRMLLKWCRQPSMQLETIVARHEAVGWLMAGRQLCPDLWQQMKQALRVRREGREEEGRGGRGRAENG